MIGMSLGVQSKGAVALGSVKIPQKYFQRFGTGVESIDNMFGVGGFIKGQIITMSAMRGAGKTTALLQILDGVTVRSDGAKRCLYLSGEEYVEQLAFTAQRINTPNVLADNITDVDQIANLTKDYDVIVIDSMNALTAAGKKSRLAIESYAMNTITKSAKENDCVVVFILHQTKSGNSSGAASIEHTADTCIKLYNVDSEEYGELNCKAFCVDKNRFGQTKDTIFRMTAKGWDFTDPIKEDYDQNTSGGKKGGSGMDPRKVKRMAELKKIMDAISKKKGFFHLKDLEKVVDDIQDFDRYTRRMKELEKMGLVKKSGRGSNARYTLTANGKKSELK